MTCDEIIKDAADGLLDGRYVAVSATRRMNPYERECITLELVSTLPHCADKHRFPAGKSNIKKVIFNDPATIIFWEDGTKTVVKCGENDIFDPEKGIAMAIAKKALGNEGNYYNAIKKWLPESGSCGCSDTVADTVADIVSTAIDRLGDTAGKFERRLLGND